MSEDPSKDWTKSTVAELKEELMSRQLVTTGLKKELIKRLQDDDDAVNNVDINAEDVINDVINAEEEGGESEEVTNAVDDGEKVTSGNCEGADMVEEEEERQKQESENATVTKDEEKSQENAKGDDTKVDEKQEKSEDVEMHDEETKDEENEEGFEEEEELNMEDMVAVDETHDEEDEENPEKGHLDEEDEKLDIQKLLKSEDEEMMVCPPACMQKWLYSTYVDTKNSCSLFVSKLTAKDVLCPAMVEWANRALYFCINHDKHGKGCAMLHYSTVTECEEAESSLKEALGEEISVIHPSSSKEKDIKKDISYVLDSNSSIRSRLLFIEGIPKDSSVENLCAVFDDAQLFVQLKHQDPTHSWEKVEYVFPEEMHNVFVVEFPTAEDVEKVMKTEKELEGQKLVMKQIAEVEEDYKRYYARKLREARDKKWDVLEKKKKQDFSNFVLTDDERLKLYRNISALNRYKGKLTTSSSDRPFENRVLEKETIVVKLYETRQKIDGDTHRRLKNDLLLPEEERFMTKHTKEEYAKLSSELKKKMEKQAKDPFTLQTRKRTPPRRRTSPARSTRREGRDRDRAGRGGRAGGRAPSRGDRVRGDSYRGRREGGRGGRRDNRPASSSWRSPDRGNDFSKRRRMDHMDSRDRRGGGPGQIDVTDTLKGLTEVLSHKMNEIERLAGGMKARERALEEAYHNITGAPGSRSGSGSFSHMGGGNSSGFSNMGFNSNSNFMAHQSGGGGGYGGSGIGGGMAGGGGRYGGGGIGRSGMGGSMDRRRSGDIDDRFSRF